MSLWKMLETWDRDLPGLTDEQLLSRLGLAREREESSNSPRPANPKARRDWRRREAVEAEMQARGLLWPAAFGRHTLAG
ncbi:hypothetical protein [Paractinoplanes deccanensis]|uniref:hypothetical protein n=1 Tax=Paractinoplanes deccanensis TaxID=113561 RepID=UPI001942F10B|nr:hypothetical protein [Actinoplanes deccanensis]